MIITHKICMDLTRRMLQPPIQVMQDDQYSRELEFTLKAGDKPWEIPEDFAALIVWHRESDKVGGSYDALPGGELAYSKKENVLTVRLIPQVCASPGKVYLSVMLASANAVAHTFTVSIDVQKNPGLQESVPVPEPDVYQQLLGEYSMMSARVNNLASLKEGSTTGDAELIDGRTDHTGQVHPNIGSHIRKVGEEVQRLEEKGVDENGNLLLLDSDADGVIFEPRYEENIPCLDVMGSRGDEAVRLGNIETPVHFGDAANKWYVDNAVAVNVKSCGAVGDGVTDDTDAIRAARDKAVKGKKPLYFPAGTYMVHGSIELWSDCEIYGEGSKSVIKKIPAVTQTIKPKGTTGSFVTGQTTFTVADGSKYMVGHDCFVGYRWENTEAGLYGKIESIAGNNVTITPYPKDILVGGAFGFVQGVTNASYVEVVLSTSFPVFCAYRYNNDHSLNALHDVYIHDLTIDGSRVKGVEANSYPVSLIHFDALGSTDINYGSVRHERVANAQHENIRLENLNLRNSPADGISVQSGKNVYITNCKTEDCSYNGVHFGVATTNASVVGCKLNADFCGYFDCAGVSSVSLSGNHFEGCPTGVGGLDYYTRGLTVNGNTFRGCGVGVCAGGIMSPQNMVDDDPNMNSYMGSPNTGITICNNTFYGVYSDGVGMNGVGVTLPMGKHFAISGNTFRNLATAIETGGTQNAQITSNVIKDCDAVLSMTVFAGLPAYTLPRLTYNSAFVGNTIHAEMSGTSATVVIANAENMLVMGNIVTGIGAGISVKDTATGVITENNIVA